MKRIVIAPDSFKESLDACQVAAAIASGVRKQLPRADVVEVPVSDGGEGLVATLVAATGGTLQAAQVTGPLGERVSAYWGILGDGTTAVVEMAQASGLVLVPADRRDPLATTSFGTGELVRCALAAGCSRVILGVGGSATNDGGAGMAQALGIRLTAADGTEISRGAGGLRDLRRIDVSGLDPRLRAVNVLAAVDVTNPLCGTGGASYVYGPQKGATPAMLPVLDDLLHHLARLVRRDLGKDILTLPGAGAAGGMGGGLAAFLGAALRPGVELVLEILDMERIFSGGTDLVITGEGEINRQTAFGKVPVGVAELAKKYALPVIAIAGSIGEGAEEVLNHGIDAYFSIVPRPLTLAQAMGNTAEFLTAQAEQLMRLFRLATERRRP